MASRSSSRDWGKNTPRSILPYSKSTAYQFAAFLRLSGKLTVTQPAHLVSDGNNRPALSLVVNQDVSLLAVHAPSVSDNISAQMRHVRNTVQRCAGVRFPKIIFGDLNMDLKGDRSNIAAAIKNSPPPLGDYWLRPMPQHTQVTHNLGKALDWALVEPNFNTSCRVLKELDDSDERLTEKSDHRPICISWT